MISIKIKSNIVPEKVSQKIKPLLMTNHYGPYLGKTIPGMTIEQAKSYRKQLLRTKAIRKAYLLNSQINKIRNLYYKKMSILSIAQKLDLPPLMILNKILYYPLTPHDKKQIKIAEANDILNNVDNKLVLQKSDLYETTVAQYLDKYNIKYITQEKLVKRQTKKYGRPVITPDFLFKKGIIINGRKVYWIDAKNYYGCEGFLLYKAKKQADKYHKKFGPGAICFALGYSEKIYIRNTLLIHIPRK